MLYRLLLSDVGFYVGIAIEAFLAIAAVVLMILVLKLGLPKLEKRESKPKKEKVPPVTYALTYVPGSALGAPVVEQYRKGAKVALKSSMFAAPVGKKFDGWSDGTNKYMSGTKFLMPEHNVEFIAQWADLPKSEPKAEEPKKEKVAPATYSLTYVSGSALGAPIVEQYRTGAKVVLKTNVFAAPVGKKFDGWSDGTNKYIPGTKFSMPEHNVEFTAQWLDLPKAEPAKEVVKEVKEEPKKAVQEESKEPIAISVDLNNPEAAQQVDGGTTPDGRPIIVNVYSNNPAGGEKIIEKETIRTIEEYSDDGLEFANYSILELYGLLSEEQKRYYDTLKQAALSKPEAKLSVTKSFENIKVGKRSILKLRIRRLITVGEYSLENDILREFRKSDPNKAGNSKIKVRPTLVAVTDESTLQTALNMIDLVHKQILES